jgi:hypothetical protein
LSSKKELFPISVGVSMLKVEVDRNRWYRGKGGKFSRLLTTENTKYGTIKDPGYERIPKEDAGKMCCLGFACLAAGMEEKDIQGMPLPSSVVSSPLKILPHKDEMQFVYYNDCESLSESEREAKLKACGLHVGIEFTFVN